LFDFGPSDGPTALADIAARYHPEDRSEGDRLFHKALEDGEPYEFNARVLISDRSFRWLHVTGTPGREASGNVARLFGTFRDITRETELQDALVQANVGLQALADVDGLTGLYNRRAFQELLTREFERWTRYGAASSFSVVLLDIDLFKAYNDAFGHPAGDDALALIGRILRENARTADIVARYGGEEFIVLMPATDALGVLASAERIRAAVEAAPWPHRRVTASFGAATTTPTTPAHSDLVAEADAALYVAKRSGRNRVVHFASSGASLAGEIPPREGAEVRKRRRTSSPATKR
jgi:diguanylate cyclase (GGDEF)-like protein